MVSRHLICPGGPRHWHGRKVASTLGIGLRAVKTSFKSGLTRFFFLGSALLKSGAEWVAALKLIRDAHKLAASN
jgi:hypothetical protein